MSSMLNSFFSRDPRTQFPYELPAESFTTVQENIFIGKSCKKSDPLEKTTCFWSSSPNGQLKLQAQKLKTLRHPNVLTFVDSLEVENTFYLITEPCRPLVYYLAESRLTDTQRELLVSWGLYQNCLKFLHNEAQLAQNNLRNAIYVTASGDWKLAAFHMSGSLSSPQTDLNDLSAVLVQMFSKNPGNDHHNQMVGPAALQALPKRLHPLYRRLCGKGKAVMAVSDILNECRAVGGFMKNKFVDTLLFLEEFQLREAPEKAAFFAQLQSNLDLFPEDIARNKILPKLIHTYEYGDAGAHILVPMFRLGKLLEEDEYQQRIVPCLVKLFSSTDRTTRVKLLERIDEFAGHLSAQVVNEKIYSNLATGFLDSNAAVRESTVKAIVVFAEKLNYSNLNTDLMKYLARLQGSDPEPSIRTNATICLGKIGCFLDPSHRQRILGAAFTRALKDPFPPARMAGVIALSATQQFFSLHEVAQRALPALAPLTVDPDKQVRDQSFKAMSGFLEKLQKASDNPELIPELEAQVKAGGRGGLLSSDKVPQWAGWAIKTISGKFYKSSAPPKEQQTAAVAANNEGTSKASKEETTTAMGTATKKISNSSSNGSQNSSAPADTGTGTSDGWGDLLGDEEDEQHSGDGDDGGSDYGDGDKKGASREDALWSAAMDNWESVQTATPSPKPSIPNSPARTRYSPSTGLKLNHPPPHTLTPEPPKTVDGPTIGIGGPQKAAAPKAMKLGMGAVKKVPAKQRIDDLFHDAEQNEAATISRESSVSEGSSAAGGGGGNFASVAKQIAQQPPKPAPKKREEGPPKVETNWQDW